MYAPIDNGHNGWEKVDMVDAQPAGVSRERANIDLGKLIDRDELVGLLTDLISIPSVNPSFQKDSNEKKIGDYVRDFFGRSKIPCEIQPVAPGRNNVIGRVDGANGSNSLLFEAHMDTASVAGMTIDPFKPEMDVDRIYGRGACDTKGGLAAMLYAMSLVKQSGVQPGSTLLLAATVDEEYSFQGVAHLVSSGMRANGAIVSEPTELDVVIAHKACLRWRIVTAGRAAHSSKAHLGINAIEKMMKLIEAIGEKLIPTYEQKQHPLLGTPTLNIGLIKGGVQVNTVPDSCTIEVDRRVLPGENKASVWSEFEPLLEELKQADPTFEATMEAPTLEDFPLETPEDERVVSLAREACNQVLGKARVCGVPYGTDASKLSRVGIPSLVLGPGSIDQAHSSDEYISIDQVLKAAEIYARIMLNS